MHRLGTELVSPQPESNWNSQSACLPFIYSLNFLTLVSFLQISLYFLDYTQCSSDCFNWLSLLDPRRFWIETTLDRSRARVRRATKRLRRRKACLLPRTSDSFRMRSRRQEGYSTAIFVFSFFWIILLIILIVHFWQKGFNLMLISNFLLVLG